MEILFQTYQLLLVHLFIFKGISSNCPFFCAGCEMPKFEENKRQSFFKSEQSIIVFSLLYDISPMKGSNHYLKYLTGNFILVPNPTLSCRADSQERFGKTLT